MIHWLGKKRYGPIGIDIGTRSVKLVQFSADQTELLDTARCDLSDATETDADSKPDKSPVAAAIRQAREGRAFRGRDAVICLRDPDLFLQNIRVSKQDGIDLARIVQQEAAGRVPFSVAEAEIRFIETADVREGDHVMREVIVMACHRPVLKRALGIVESAGLQPVAVDVEPAALLRGYVRQFRRDEDRVLRSMLVHVGYRKTAVVIAQGDDVLFIKYVDVGGRQMDDAVARLLKMEPSEAAALRRHNGDRRGDQEDPEVARSINDAVRSVVDRLATELSMCVRYHSVTFRGQPLTRLLLGGGEASSGLAESLGKKLSLQCELGDPLRSFQPNLPAERRGQWDIASGLALKEVE